MDGELSRALAQFVFAAQLPSFRRVFSDFLRSAWNHSTRLDLVRLPVLLDYSLPRVNSDKRRFSPTS